MILKDQKQEKVYSDGESVELEMLNIANKYPEDLSQDYIANDSRYTINNTFSAVRRNILNWYPFKEGCSILEVGAGMGSLTGLLCDVAEHVTSLEMSEYRASVIKARYPERRNLEITSADIFNWDDKRKFDYIVVIGVLEYAAIFSDAQNPYIQFIRCLKEHLAEDGKVLLAIENRFGIKYFTGASEDHLQKPFVGLEGYEKKGPRTFSKYELEKNFEEAGLVNHRTYMVFPDYKFPEIVCTEEKLPDYQTLQKISFTHGNNSAMLFDEKRIYKDLIENGTLPFFANSFLIEASKNKLDDKHVVYVSARSECKKQYRIDTVINNKNEIIKKPVHPEAQKHIDNVYNNTQILRKRGVQVGNVSKSDGYLICEYVSGESAQGKFEALLEKNDINSIYKMIDELKLNLSLSSDVSQNEIDEFFADFDKKEIGDVLEHGFVDMTFYNAVIHDGKMTFFDQEWDFPNIPKKFILYYAIKSAYTRCNVYTDITMEQLLKYIDVSLEDIRIFDAFESSMWNRVVLRGLDKYGADGYCNLYCNQPEGYDELINKIKNGEIKDIIKAYYVSKEVDKIRNKLNESYNKLADINKKNEEISEKLNSIENSFGWRIVSFPGKFYVLSVKVIRRCCNVISRYLKAINKNNIAFLWSSFRKGGITQVRKELNAFKYRQNGEEEPCEVPQLFPDIKDVEWNALEALTFSEESEPLVSIIIPVYNQFGYTYNCLKSILINTHGIAYEIIIADDCSTDNTRILEQKIHNIKVIHNKQNYRFLLNCNNAAKSARGKYIVFLNNDTQVMDNWLEPLVNIMNKDNSVGMVGSKLIYPDGSLQEAGGIVWKNGEAWNYGNGKNPNKPEFSYVKESDYISGAAIMIKKTLWDEIGGFDERFVPAYYEDTDLAFEVRKHGYKVMFQPASIVVHFEGKSNGTDLSSGQKSYQVANAKKFYDKWQDELNKNHFDNGQEVFFARDRSRNQKHILVIDHYIPHFDNDAGGRCTYMYLQQFVRMGMRVTFVGDNFAQDEPYKSILLQQGVEILYGNWYALHFEEWLAINGKNFDYVYSQRPHITIKYLDMIKKYCPGKFFYFDHDLHHLREQREYEITKDESLLESSKRWKEIEFKIIEAADVVHVVGSFEQEYLHKQFPDKIVRNIPLYIYEEIPNDIPKDFDKRKDILFVGGFGHPPNLDAVMWFNKEIFPKVVEKYPDIKWHIVGNKAPKEVLDLASDNIIVDGFVSDERLQELYKTCRLAVVPLRYGAGVKGKVVEAAYYQLPMITTSIGAEGMPTTYGSMVIVDEAVELADQIINLYTNYSELKRMSDNCIAFIGDNFSLKSVEVVLGYDMK